MANLEKLKYRHVNFALFCYATIMMLVAFLFFQKLLGLMPCPLCVTQRIFAVMFGTVALIGSLHNPAPHKQRIYSTVIALCAAGGAAISGRQVHFSHCQRTRSPPAGPRYPT